MTPAFDKFILARRSVTVLLCAIVIIITSIGTKELYFRGDYRVFFEPDNPQRVAYERMQNTFTKNETASIIISAKNGDLFTPRSLQLIESLTKASWQTPLSTRVDSISNFQHMYNEQGDLMIEDLIYQAEQLNDADIQTIKTVSLSEPDLLHKLISSDGRVTMINITAQLPDGDQTKEISQIGAFLRDLLEPYKAAYPDHEFRLSGIVIMTDAMFLAAIKDATTLFPLMFLAITVLLVILLRSFMAMVVTFIVVITSISATMGLGGWLGMFINIATVNVPVIIATLAIADSVHIIASVRHFMRQGENQHNAILQSLRINRTPVIITSVTTAIGFLTLNFAKVPILADMGNLVAIGVIFACAFSLVLLPVMLSMFTIKAPEPNPRTIKFWNSLAQLCGSHYKTIVIFASAITIFSVYFAGKNELNDIAIEYFNEENTFRQHADYQQQHLSGLSTIDFGIYTLQAQQINEPAFLHLIDDFTQWLLSQPEVDHVYSYSNTLKRLAMHINDGDKSHYAIPESRELSAQYQLLYEMSLPYGLDMNNQIDIEKSAVRVMVTLHNLGSKDFTNFEQRAKDWIAQRAPSYMVDAASLPLIFAHIGKANMQGMLQGAIIALVLISGLLIIALRNIKLGMMSLLPNLLPALFGFALWAFISGYISMALSVVITMTLGIIVDDTVHFLAKYQKARQSGKDVHQSVEYTFRHVGDALTITTLVLACGFIILAFSDFAINSEMGLLTAIIIVAALIIDLLILPAVIFLTQKDNTSPQ